MRVEMRTKSVLKTLLVSVSAAVLACACQKAAQADVAVESVVLSAQSLELTAGESATLTATLRPSDATDRSVVWTSTKSSVATVNAEGKVTAVAQGHSYIVAQNPASGVKASCLVTVRDIPAYGITVTTSGGAEVGEVLYAYPGMSLGLSVTSDDSKEHSFSWETEGEVSVTDGILTVAPAEFAPAEGYLHFSARTVRVVSEDGFYKEFDVISNILSSFSIGGVRYSAGDAVSFGDGKSAPLSLLRDCGEDEPEEIPASAYTPASSDVTLVSFAVEDGVWMLKSASGRKGDTELSVKTGDYETALCSMKVAIDPDRDGTIDDIPYINY